MASVGWQHPIGFLSETATGKETATVKTCSTMPDVVGQHDNLKVGIIGFMFGLRDYIFLFFLDKLALIMADPQRAWRWDPGIDGRHF